MAVPKKRTSVSRKGLRRAGQHHKMSARNTISCSNCKSPILPYTICSACGYYRDKEAIKIRVRQETQEQEKPQE